MQLQVNHDAGMDYTDLIKVGLRHRPDVFIVGEIRDAMTAEAAIKAALSGHLVYTTVHAQDPLGVIDRLKQLGISDEFISQALTGVAYQRLIPTVEGNQRAMLMAHEYFELEDLKKNTIGVNGRVDSQQPLKTSWLRQQLRKSSNSVRKWPVTTQANFFDLLANLLSIGFSLTEALKFIADTDKQLSRGVLVVIASLKSGKAFSESVQPLIETQAYHQLLIAEKHGQLSEILNELARFDRLRLKQLKKIKAMLVYPLFLCLILGTLILMIRLYVFPQIQDLMPNIDSHPQTSMWSQVFKLLPIPIFIGIVGALICLTRQDAITRVQLIVKIPFIGQLFRKYIAYYLASNLAILLKNGLSVKEIYVTLSEFKPGSLVHLLGEKLHSTLLQGQSVKQLVDRHNFIPNEIVKFMSSGNTIPEMANSMTAYSRLMFDEMILSTDKMIGFIQPAMFVVIGVTIVSTYFQLLIPIYNSVKGMY